MKAIDAKALPAEAWRPVEPAAGRATNRVSEREFERIAATLGLRGGKSLRVALWDFSLHGFAVLIAPNQSTDLIPVADELVRLWLDFGEGPMQAECLVKNISRFKGRTRLGLARRDLSRRRKDPAEMSAPQGEYLRLPASLDVRAEAVNPLFYGETALLTLAGARPGFKLEFLCSDPSMPLFLGQDMEIHLVLPSTGDNRYGGRIVHLEYAPGGALKLRLEPHSVGASLANDLGELLAHEAGIAPDTLQRFAFPTRFFRDRVTFRFVETMAEYAEVLNLRRNAYVEAGKRAPDTVPEAMSIAWDKSSRILCAYHDGKLLASAALTFPDREDTPLRSETAFPGNRFPGDPPPKLQSLEVNSLCTHKDYRKGDLLRALFEQISRIFVLSDRRYIMNLADDNLLPMYLAIGFKDQGFSGDFLGRRHHLIKADREVILNSRGLGWLRWNLLYGDLMDDLIRKRMIKMNAWERIRLACRLALRPLAQRMYRKKGEREFGRKIREPGREEKAAA